MSRPLEYECMTVTTVSTERSLLVEAKRRGINISKLFTKALSDALQNKVEREVHKSKLHIPKAVLNKFENMVTNVISSGGNPYRIAEIQATKISASLGVDITPKDLMEYINR
jgi:post-segregation antitoxin (ccd killing protein)